MINRELYTKKFFSHAGPLFLILLLSFSHVLLASQNQQYASEHQVTERNKVSTNRRTVQLARGIHFKLVRIFSSFAAWCARYKWKLFISSVLVMMFYFLLLRHKIPVEPIVPSVAPPWSFLAFCSRHKWKLSISLMLIGLICVVRCYVVPRYVFPGQCLLDLPASNYLGNPSATNITKVTTKSGLEHVYFNKEPGSNRTDRKLVLWFGGNGEVNTLLKTINSRLGFIKEFCPACDVLLAGRPGYGGSAGSVSSDQNIYGGADEIYEHLIGLGYKPENIYVAGFSMGNTAAIYLAATRDVGRLLCFAPFTSLPAVVQDNIINLPLWLIRILTGFVFPNNGFMEQVKVPTMIFHGTNDRIIPHSHGKDLATAYCNANAGCSSPDEMFFSIDGATHRNLIRKVESGLNDLSNSYHRAAETLKKFFSD